MCMRLAWVVVFCVSMALGSARAERLRGPTGEIREVPIESVEYALKAGWARLDKVWMRTAAGSAMEVDADLADTTERGGAWRMTPDEVRAEIEMRAAMRQAEERARRHESHILRGPTGDVISPPAEQASGYMAQGYAPITETEAGAIVAGAIVAAPGRSDNVWTWRLLASLVVGLAVCLLIRSRLASP